MTPSSPPNRRDFLKGFGSALGAASLGIPEIAHAAGPPRLSHRLPRTVSNASVFPELNERSLGWLHFLWQKSTTPDNWSRWGVPHQWWDVYSTPGVTSFGRFDLSYSSYAVLMMADQTPAWREVYTRIMDEMIARYPTYWGAVDWLTQIGDDPARPNYPPQFLGQIPERLRGNYNRIGWTANGVEPWGLDPDPIGSDGYLFFRAWFNLMLSIYRYVSGDTKWEQPFAVTGYAGEEYQWDHHRVVQLLESQYRAHPEGPHCENTKIWPYCNSAGGLGMYLYDRIHGRSTHAPFGTFIEYLKNNYMGVSGSGQLEWFTSWYDPLVDYKANGGAGSGMIAAFLLLPQDPELAAFIYEASANAQGWNNPATAIRPNSTALLMARELGDNTAIERLSAAAEREYEPKFFGEDNEFFGWFFNLPEAYPRGQQSAMMMVSEVGQPGAWMRAFEAPHLDKYAQPTVEGIDFPNLGVSQAWNDLDAGALHVATYPVRSDRAGQPTSWRVANLPDPSQTFILIDGRPFERFEVIDASTIRLDTDSDPHRYQIYTGVRAANQTAHDTEVRRPGAGALAASFVAQRSADPGAPAGGPAGGDLLSGPGGGCPCCASA